MWGFRSRWSSESTARRSVTTCRARKSRISSAGWTRPASCRPRNWKGRGSCVSPRMRPGSSMQSLSSSPFPPRSTPRGNPTWDRSNRPAHRVSSIRVAEAAKVIENTQRDLNIAFVNELAIIFDKLGLDTAEVLSAAGTKWNFAPFRPGLVGGHCIGVDPYYLTHKAELLGYPP